MHVVYCSQVHLFATCNIALQVSDKSQKHTFSMLFPNASVSWQFSICLAKGISYFPSSSLLRPRLSSTSRQIRKGSHDSLVVHKSYFPLQLHQSLGMACTKTPWNGFNHLKVKGPRSRSNVGVKVLWIPDLEFCFRNNMSTLRWCRTIIIWFFANCGLYIPYKISSNCTVICNILLLNSLTERKFTFQLNQ